MVENALPTGDSPPLHVHRDEDELFVVLSGELRVRVAGEELRLGPGESALAPKGVAHTYRVDSRDGARCLIVTAQGGFERFARAAGRPAEHSLLPELAGPPTPEQLAAFSSLASAHGIHLVGPPLT